MYTGQWEWDLVKYQCKCSICWPVNCLRIIYTNPKRNQTHVISCVYCKQVSHINYAKFSVGTSSRYLSGLLLYIVASGFRKAITKRLFSIHNLTTFASLQEYSAENWFQSNCGNKYVHKGAAMLGTKFDKHYDFSKLNALFTCKIYILC